MRSPGLKSALIKSPVLGLPFAPIVAQPMGVVPYIKHTPNITMFRKDTLEYNASLPRDPWGRSRLSGLSVFRLA